MITEKKFAVAYTSFWNTVSPLADRYVRLQNAQVERFDAPLEPSVPPKMRGVTNELGFRVFCTCHAEGLSVSQLDIARVAELADEAIEFITRFRELSQADSVHLDQDTIREALRIADRLLKYYQGFERASIKLRPELPGVGILDTCAADVIAGDTLYEIKAAERSFRVIDVRQVLVYCALNYAAGLHKITQVALLNPRMGTYFSQPIEQLASEVSGATAVELFEEILEFIGRGYSPPDGE